MRQSIRFRILERDQFRCRYCGAEASETVKLQVDHIHPRAEGGTDDDANLVTACWDCNIGKGKRVLRPIPKSEKRRYNVRTPSRDVDMDALRLEYPEGSHCVTPLKIAAMGHLMGFASYAQSHRFCASLAMEKQNPMPPMRRSDAAWFRIVAADPIHETALVTVLSRKLANPPVPPYTR